VDSPWLRSLIARIPQPEHEQASPVHLDEVELAHPLPTFDADSAPTSLVLVRLHGEPLGVVELGPNAGPVSPDILLARIEALLGDRMALHLDRDGLDSSHVNDGDPRCRRETRERGAKRTATVVVPTHDRTNQLRACVRSLLALDHPAFEVVVVDNAPSEDATERMVGKEFASDPRVRYLREPCPGASRARNLGVSAARGEVVAFTDDDAAVDPGWLSALIAGFDLAPGVTCVTGLTLPIALETAAQQAFELYGGMSLGFTQRLFDAHTPAETRLYPYTAGIFGASNNAAFLRGPLLERGGFDVRLGPATPAFGAEDLDAFLALILAGEALVYEPRALVRHEHRREFTDLYWQVFTYAAGLTAMLTKWALADRSVAADLARRVPALIPAALFTAHRGGAEAGVGQYPPQLRWLERAGLLYGPIAYARSWARAR
jgi:GT2 family glycosyltransferase